MSTREPYQAEMKLINSLLQISDGEGSCNQSASSLKESNETSEPKFPNITPRFFQERQVHQSASHSALSHLFLMEYSFGCNLHRNKKIVSYFRKIDNFAIRLYFYKEKKKDGRKRS
jgi:hypothetical protein